MQELERDGRVSSDQTGDHLWHSGDKPGVGKFGRHDHRQRLNVLYSPFSLRTPTLVFTSFRSSNEMAVGSARRRYAPYPHFLVAASGGEKTAVGAESQPVDRIAVPRELRARLAGFTLQEVHSRRRRIHSAEHVGHER